jgi:hypothetical protein
VCDVTINCVSIMKPTWCTFHSIYWESRASTCFGALLAHPQEALHKRHLVYCVRIMSVGCDTVVVKLQPCHSQLTRDRTQSSG